MGTPVFLCSHRHLLYNTKGEHCFLVSSTASVLFSFQQHNLINQDNCQGENLWQLPLQKALILQSVLTAHPSYGWATRGLAWAQDARLQLLKCFSQIDIKPSPRLRNYPFRCVYPSDSECFQLPCHSYKQAKVNLQLLTLLGMWNCWFPEADRVVPESTLDEDNILAGHLPMRDNSIVLIPSFKK